MRRALTMVELLLALSLLSMLMVAVSAWIQTPPQTAAEFSEPLQWKSAADAVMDLIQDDLMAGDFESDSKNDASAPAKRVRVEDGKLLIQTRDHGPASHAYVMDAFRGELSRSSMDSQSERAKKLLLGRVKRFECIHDEKTKNLSAMVESVSGQVVSRSFHLR